MKKNKIILLSAMVTFYLCSCSTTNDIITQVTSSETNTRTANFQTIDITQNKIYQKPLVCDLEVSKERYSITKTYENMGMRDAKENVAGEFSIEKNCDYLVQPLYQTNTTTADGKTTTTVSLSAYPAYYKNIRTFEPTDLSSFQINNFVGLNNNALSTQKAKEPETAVASTASSSVTQTITQIKKNSKTHLAIALDAGTPTGDWKDIFRTGLGGSLIALTELGKFVSVPTSVTFMRFKGKEINQGFGFRYQIPNATYLCAKTGLRIGNLTGIYGEGQIGYSRISSDGSSESNACWSFGAGYVQKKFDLGLRYESFGNSDVKNKFIGVKLAYFLN